MGYFFDILQTAYDTAYSEGLKKKYTDPKIYHGGEHFDLSKRWYVYFSYEHPTEKDVNGEPKMTRQTPVYAKINQRFHTKRERLHQLNILKDILSEMLKDGHSPYEGEMNMKTEEYTAESALDFAHTLKIKTLNPTSIMDYESRFKRFKKYLDSRNLLKRSILNIDKKVVNAYLNSILNTSSARNRNNTRTVLSAHFTVLEENDIIPKNFIQSIKPLKTNPQRNKTYTLKMVDELYEFLSEKDPQLLLFIKLVSYNFLRPIEVCRIKVGDLNLEQNQLYVKAKNKVVKTKIIPNIILEELEKLDLNNAQDYLITPEGVGPWATSEVNKRDYFSKRFKKVKDAYNVHLEKIGETYRLGKDHTVYSFRHTFITKLYREMRNECSRTETHDRLMLITGHSSLQALVSYLRDIDAELPEDYSNYLK
ncbi:site-specific integrase [uncultured Maribacter sp.]|uniref:tyrosine-type recombinase/integrase n=1 Tax=uncultured Maribacter sp. TaxID=431308 RepID=UPI00262C9C89|nr:site-specific integrase [uncultured Maribacter sp.]